MNVLKHEFDEISEERKISLIYGNYSDKLMIVCVIRGLFHLCRTRVIKGVYKNIVSPPPPAYIV
ncbi:MAG: hypothetical protein LBK66_00555 [Spirochaetaceae bacterium]|nr:hypothetical protein [Spirochaetaceae bacterium]